MRNFIGFAIVIISIYLFGWWSFLSLLVALPFIGWKDRHKGPFPTEERQTRSTDYNAAQHMAVETPNSFRLMQDILVEVSEATIKTDDLLIMLNQLLKNIRIEKRQNDNQPDRKLLQDFLKQFSKTFPNWQGEYAILSNLIDANY